MSESLNQFQDLVRARLEKILERHALGAFEFSRLTTEYLHDGMEITVHINGRDSDLEEKE